MNKRLFVAIFLLLILTTYSVQHKFNFNHEIKIKKIIIANNKIVHEKRIIRDLSFLYEKNPAFISTNKIQEILTKIDFIESFEIKKIYPDKIKIKIFEKKPIVILQNKKEKKYYTSSGDLVDFLDLNEFKNLPIVFGDKKNFEIFYEILKNLKFPINEIKALYLFETKRWDLITFDDQIVKLPINNFESSLKNFIELREKLSFSKYKTFDYRINGQLILK